jgi:hypothetical protein
VDRARSLTIIVMTTTTTATAHPLVAPVRDRLQELNAERVELNADRVGRIKGKHRVDDIDEMLKMNELQTMRIEDLLEARQQEVAQLAVETEPPPGDDSPLIPALQDAIAATQERLNGLQRDLSTALVTQAVTKGTSPKIAANLSEAVAQTTRELADLQAALLTAQGEREEAARLTALAGHASRIAVAKKAAYERVTLTQAVEKAGRELLTALEALNTASPGIAQAYSAAARPLFNGRYDHSLPLALGHLRSAMLEELRGVFVAHLHDTNTPANEARLHAARVSDMLDEQLHNFQETHRV